MLSGPSLGETAQERSVGSWEGSDEQGLGMPRAAWPGPPLLPANWEVEIQSASPHPPGTSVSPRRSQDHLRAVGGAGRPGSAPPPHPSQGKGRLEEGVGGQPGGGRQGQRSGGKREGSLAPRAERRFGLGFESQKRRSWVWGGRAAPTSGGKPLNCFGHVWPQQFPSVYPVQSRNQPGPSMLNPMGTSAPVSALGPGLGSL